MQMDEFIPEGQIKIHPESIKTTKMDENRQAVIHNLHTRLDTSHAVGDNKKGPIYES